MCEPRHLARPAYRIQNISSGFFIFLLLLYQRDLLKNTITIVLLSTLLLSCSKDDRYDPYLIKLENEVFFLVNNHRTSKNLPPLVMEEVITYEARKHSINMSSGSIPFGHDGFSERVATIKQSIPSTGACENVGWNSGDAETIFSLWLSSSGHRANIEGSFTRTGIGVSRSANGSYYYTEIFIK